MRSIEKNTPTFNQDIKNKKKIVSKDEDVNIEISKSLKEISTSLTNIART